MSWRPHPRLARTSARAPRAWGTCDRCGFIANHNDLRYQYEWRGLQVMNTFILVCQPCLDDLQRQLGSIILPPDPKPIFQARVEPYPVDELWEMMMEGGSGLGAMPFYLEKWADNNGLALGMSLELSSIPASTST